MIGYHFPAAIVVVIIGTVVFMMAILLASDVGDMTPREIVHGESTNRGAAVAECLLSYSIEFREKYGDEFDKGRVWGPDDTATFGSLAASYAEIMCTE